VKVKADPEATIKVGKAHQTLCHVIDEHACRTQGFPDLQLLEDNPTDVQKNQLTCTLGVVPFVNKPVFK
jgi:hypothetical protein